MSSSSYRKQAAGPECEPMDAQLEPLSKPGALLLVASHTLEIVL